MAAPNQVIPADRLPIVADDGGMVVFDRPKQDHYHMVINDEAFVGLLEMIDRYLSDTGYDLSDPDNLPPMHVRSLISVCRNLPYPSEGVKAIRARSLIAQANYANAPMYICPYCTGDLLIKTRWSIVEAECRGCKKVWDLDDTVKIKPKMYTEQVVALLNAVEAARSSG